MLAKNYKLGHHLYRLLFYSLWYPDVEDFSRFAIYMAASLVERPAPNLEGVIGHEIAHIIAARGQVRITRQDLGLILKSRKEYLEQKESAARNFYRCFSEPIRSEIKEWNEQSLLPAVEDQVVKGMRIVDQQEFDALVFGARLAAFKEFIRNNLQQI